jgi:predicted aminopeptidase
VEEVLQNPYTPEKIKTSIRFVQKGKDFSKEIGLKPTQSYREYVALDTPYVVQALSAANPLKLEPMLWHFPIVGDLPYLGFFSSERAENEMSKLRSEWDVHLRPVPAYSSLGWFADLLYSSMLGGTEADIVELVLHESFHATLWIPNNVDFNERLASFVGSKGALEYLRKQGALELVQKAIQQGQSEAVFGLFIKSTEENYKKNVKSLADKEKFYAKLDTEYDHFVQSMKKQYPLSQRLNLKLASWNNAQLLAFSNYYSDPAIFERHLKLCANDIKRLIAGLKMKEHSLQSAPEEFLHSYPDQCLDQT